MLTLFEYTFKEIGLKWFLSPFAKTMNSPWISSSRNFFFFFRFAYDFHAFLCTLKMKSTSRAIIVFVLGKMCFVTFRSPHLLLVPPDSCTRLLLVVCARDRSGFPLCLCVSSPAIFPCILYLFPLYFFSVLSRSHIFADRVNFTPVPITLSPESLSKSIDSWGNRTCSHSGPSDRSWKKHLLFAMRGCVMFWLM